VLEERDGLVEPGIDEPILILDFVLLARVGLLGLRELRQPRVVLEQLRWRDPRRQIQIVAGRPELLEYRQARMVFPVAASPLTRSE
jgi:hypothetical protein